MPFIVSASLAYALLAVAGASMPFAIAAGIVSERIEPRATWIMLALTGCLIFSWAICTMP